MIFKGFFFSAILLAVGPLQARVCEKSVLVFMSTVCPCSQSHREHLGELANRFPQVCFKAIYTEQNIKKAQLFTQFTPASKVEVVENFDGNLARKMGAVKTPHAFVVDEPTSEVLYQGKVTDSLSFESARTFYLQRVLEELIQEKKSPDQLTHKKNSPIGCYIDLKEPPK